MVLEKGEIVFSKITKGVNLLASDSFLLSTLLENEVASDVDGVFVPIKRIVFYGTGIGAEGEARAERILKKSWPSADVQVFDDSLTAVHALCERKEGFACVLSAVAECSFYNGKCVEQSLSPASKYVVGNHGSAPYLGRRLLQLYASGDMNAELKGIFEQAYGALSTRKIVQILGSGSNGRQFWEAFPGSWSKIKDTRRFRS